MSDQQLQKPGQGAGTGSSGPSSTPPNPAPILCAANCGFFGNPKTGGMCSKCFKTRNPTLTTPTASPSLGPSPTPSDAKSTSSSPALTSSSAPSTTSTSTPSTTSPSPSRSPTFLPLPGPSIPLPPLSSSSSTSTSSSSSSSTSSSSPSSSSPPSPSMGSSPSPSASPPSSPILGPSGSPEKKKTPRCAICSVKVGINYFTCKCSDVNLFCSSHRHPFEHKCTFDHKGAQRSKLSTSNPTVKGDKLEDRL